MIEERTTNLADLKTGIPFTWGELVRIHEIGEYAIVEFHSWKYENCHQVEGIEESPSFHCYINGNDTCNSTHSLDAVLAKCIAYKTEGSNSYAAEYFMKMIAPDVRSTK